MRNRALAICLTFCLRRIFGRALLLPFLAIFLFLLPILCLVHALRVCLAIEGVQQSHPASAASLITSSVPNLSLTHTSPSSNCSFSVVVYRGWEKLRSIGVELKAHHRQQRRLQPRPQAASLSSTLLLSGRLLVSGVSPGTTSLDRAATGG